MFLKGYPLQHKNLQESFVFAYNSGVEKFIVLVNKCVANNF